jgi:hypothetical protein
MWRRVACLSGGVVLSLVVLADTAAQQAQQQPKATHVQGQIVRVDPQTSTVTVRTTNGKETVDRQYKIETGTQFYGSNRKPFFDGLSNKGWKQGTDFWYQLGSGKQENTIMDMRMYNPAEQAPGAGLPPKK